jgi:spoIIIJ-associated protein
LNRNRNNIIKVTYRGIEMKKNSRRHVPQPRRIELDYSEKWGKDVEEATRLALADLKISENEAKVTVLEQPTKGFLGIGAKLAKVRVEKKSELDETPADQPPAASDSDKPASAETLDESAETLGIGRVRDLRKNKSEGATGAVASGRGAGGRPAGPGRSEGRGGGRRERGGERERGESRERGGERGERRERGEEKENKSESRSYWISSNSSSGSGRGGRGNRIGFGRPDKPSESASAERSSESLDAGSFSFNEKPTDLRPVADGNAAETFFREITEKMGLDINIRVLENDECVYVEVDGKDSRTVIGKRGQTLDAIQYLTNLVMNKSRDNYIRVIVDVEGYRSRREKTLEQLAVKLAKKVEKTGRNMRLEPMNPYERKVIHATLQSNGKISTRSEGEEPYRRVIIERK